MTFAGIVTFLSEVQPKNACLPTAVTLSWIVTLLSLDRSLNALAGIDVIVSGIVTEVFPGGHKTISVFDLL